MANKIQIKRSTTTAAPTGLANGELAYSANGGVLFIGAPADGTTLAIGGLRNPGVLTANQALVANSTSGIDKVIVANLAPTAIWANGSIGTAGQILASNGSVVYWAPAPSGVTDLTDSANATTVSIFSSTGTDVVIDGANSSTAGVMTAADKTKLDGITAGATTYDLLAVANTAANQGIIRLDGANTSVANDDILFVGANGIVVSSNSTAILITGQIDTNTTYDILTVANTTVGVVTLDPSTGANDDIRFIGTGGIEISSDAGGNVTVNLDQTLSITDLTLSGNLVVNGTLTTLDVDTVRIEDPLISLARNQTAANALDIGFYGTFGNSTVTSYSGLFRDATDSKYRLFTGAIPEPTTTVDTANVNYAGATLVVQALEGASATSFIDNFILDGGTF